MDTQSRQRNGLAPASPGRNEPCPCGSGLKYKRCCAGKPISRAAAAAPPHPPGGELAQVQALRNAGRFAEAQRLAEHYVERNPREAAGHAALGVVHLYAGHTDEAIPPLIRAIRLAPNVAQHHYDLGLALETASRDGEAITAFRTAISLDPRRVEAHERLGHLLRMHESYAEATECFRRAAAIAPETIGGRLNRVQVLLDEGDRAGAEALLRESVARHPDHAEAKRALASLLREQGRFEEALPLLEGATEGTPVQAAAAYYGLVNSKRITADDQPVLAQLHALADYRPLTEPARLQVQFALGKAYDDLGEYAKAMQHFDAGNAIAARRRPFDRAHFGASVHRVRRAATPAFFAAHRGLGSASELPVLIIGMPRSGTTLVEQILSSHRDVAAGDELPFWNNAARDFARLGQAAASAEHVHRLAGEYEALLRKIAPDARRVTDKTPGNFLWLGIFALAFPRGRIIHCRRNPLDTCLSNYFTNFMAPMTFAYDKGHLAFYYRTYRRLMNHWRTVLPREALLEVDYEALVAQPEPVTRQMIDFLGLDWDESCLRPQDNRRIIRTASQWQVRQPTYRGSVERWRRYEAWLGDLRGLLEDPDGGGPVHPASDNATIPAARRLREAGRLDEAIAALQAALRAAPHDAVLYNELGTIFLQSGRAAEAVECCERAIGLVPNFAVAHYNLGAALERQGRATEATAALREAIALAPHLGAAHSRLGNLLQAQGEQQEALACFERASRLLADPADRELEQAKLLRAEGRSAEAEAALRRVVALAPGNPLAHAMLGDVLGEWGRFEEATAHLRRATELDPDRVGAWHNLMILRRVGDADRPLVEQMETMLERPALPDFDRALLHFALGKAYDDLDEPERAIAHFDQANVLEHRRHPPFDRAALAAGIDRLIETFSPEAIARLAPSGAPSEAPVLVLGMPRSGTTLVEQILSAHPAVAAGGELTFWSDAAATAHDAATRARLAADYLALLRRLGPGAARVTDKNPFNFLAIGLIHLALPRARFIHCRRDPVDTCLSIYFARFATPQPFAYDRGDLVFYYREYARLMAHWSRVLPPERLLAVDYEALTAAPAEQARRIVAFCGLAWDEACLAPERNPRAIRTASLWQARQPVYRRSVERWRRYEPWLGELAELSA